MRRSWRRATSTSASLLLPPPVSRRLRSPRPRRRWRELGVEVAESASEAVRGDALTGVLLAEAAASAAFRLVEINVGAGPVLERARRAELRAVGARASATGRPPPPPHVPIPR